MHEKKKRKSTNARIVDVIQGLYRMCKINQQFNQIILIQAAMTETDGQETEQTMEPTRVT